MSVHWELTTVTLMLNVLTFLEASIVPATLALRETESTAQVWLVCVTTVTMPVHLHGTNFAPFLLLTRRCYDAETSAILLLLKRAFA